MTTTRIVLLFLAGLGALASCSDGTGAPLDAPDTSPDGGSTSRHSYVVSRLRTPLSAAEATMVGLDIDDRANDGVDNQLGTFLASLATLAPALGVAAPTARAVDRGLILMLFDLSAANLATSAGASLQVSVGADPQPPACAGAADLSCRHHLDGTGAFARAPGLSPGGPLPGAIVAGRFNGGPGTFFLPLAFDDQTIVRIPVQRARAELSGLLATGFGGVSRIGGAIAQSDMTTVVLPGLHAAVAATIDHDCPPPRSPPTCGCGPGSSGLSLLGFLDTNDDCTATLAEVVTAVNGVVTPDLDLNGDGQFDAVSIGVGIDGVAATFPAP